MPPKPPNLATAAAAKAAFAATFLPAYDPADWANNYERPAAFHTLSTLAHALFRYRLVSSFAQTPRVEAPTNEAGERAAPPLIGRPL